MDYFEMINAIIKSSKSFNNNDDYKEIIKERFETFKITTINKIINSIIISNQIQQILKH